MVQIVNPAGIASTGLARVAEGIEEIAFHLSGMDSAGEIDHGVLSGLIQNHQAVRDFPEGTLLQENHSVYGAFPVNVIGHDLFPDAEGHADHTMAVWAKYGITNRQFDAPEALFYFKDGLAAGQYYFVLPENYDSTYNDLENDNVSFTLTQAIPAGGQLCLSWSYQTQLSKAKINTYAGPSSTAVIESVAVSAGKKGTELGTVDHRDVDTGINHIAIARYGYNRYSQSAILQWLNATLEHDWWNPQSVFDRPPSYAAQPGFLSGFDPEVIEHMAETTVTVALNTITDGGGVETVTAKVHLLSSQEQGFGRVNSVDEGVKIDYFDGMTADDRIKFSIENKTAKITQWHRSPSVSAASYVRFTYTSGTLSYTGAYYGGAAVPAWNYK